MRLCGRIETSIKINENKENKMKKERHNHKSEMGDMLFDEFADRLGRIYSKINVRSLYSILAKGNVLEDRRSYYVPFKPYINWFAYNYRNGKLSMHNPTVTLEGQKGIEKLLNKLFIEKKINKVLIVRENDFRPERFFCDAWRLIPGKPVHLKLKFSKDIAQWIVARTWHKTQKIQEQEDGSVIMELKIDGVFSGWIMSFGSNVEVLEPIELREEISIELKQAGMLYQ